jgi:hypothetical protein
LREIAAASDFDFIAAEPRRPAKSAARQAGPAARARGRKTPDAKAPAWLQKLWTWRTPIFGGLGFVALLCAIAVNAMFLQHGRHPAPLLGSTIRIEPPKPQAAKSELAKPALRAAVQAALLEKPINPPVPAAPVAAEAAPAESAAVPAPAPKSRDVIGALIGDETLAAPALPAKKIMAAQRALQKLGAPVKPDGEYGAATRKAVEAFQRDNHLPPTGELTPKLRQLLSLRSGVAID